VRPVVEAVAPVTEPLLRPVVAAAEPVLDPVAAVVAPVTEPVVAAGAPAAIEAPVVVPGGGSSSALVVWFAEPVSVYLGLSMAPFSSAPQQDVPGPPVYYAVTGGGAVGGSGGAHGADVLPSVSDGVRSEQDAQCVPHRALSSERHGSPTTTGITRADLALQDMGKTVL
jgi:hypothetical protein